MKEKERVSRKPRAPSLTCPVIIPPPPSQAWVLQGMIMFESGDVEGALEQLKRSRDMHANTTTLGGTKIFLEPRYLAECLNELGQVPPPERS